MDLIDTQAQADNRYKYKLCFYSLNRIFEKAKHGVVIDEIDQTIAPLSDGLESVAS